MSKSSGKSTSSSGGKSSSSTAVPTQRKYPTFFINGDGIDREVITTDICRYLGNDALVKPGIHQDNNTGAKTDGFYITAYRAPTSEQLADLRASSAKWREERRRNTARSQGGYDGSDTYMQQEARLRGNFEETRPQASGYAPTTYGQMGPPMNPTMGPRPVDLARVGFPSSGSTAMAPQPGLSSRYPGYQPPEQNYTYATTNPPSQYNVVDNDRNRMDINQGQPWGMPQGSNYQPAGAPSLPAGYPARGQPYNYPQGSGNPAIPSGYGRGEPPDAYSPYGPRDPGATQPDPQEYNYNANEDYMMDEDEEIPPAQGTAAGQHRRERERERDGRDSRERHDEPKKQHRHR